MSHAGHARHCLVTPPDGASPSVPPAQDVPGSSIYREAAGATGRYQERYKEIDSTFGACQYFLHGGRHNVHMMIFGKQTHSTDSQYISLCWITYRLRWNIIQYNDIFYQVNPPITDQCWNV